MNFPTRGKFYAVEVDPAGPYKFSSGLRVRIIAFTSQRRRDAWVLENRLGRWSDAQRGQRRDILSNEAIYQAADGQRVPLNRAEFEWRE